MALNNSSQSNQLVRKGFDEANSAHRVTSISGAMVTVPFDAVSVTYPAVDTEIYEFKTGGISGTVVATVTVIYTSSTKEFISSAEKT